MNAVMSFRYDDQLKPVKILLAEMGCDWERIIIAADMTDNARHLDKKVNNNND